MTEKNNIEFIDNLISSLFELFKEDENESVAFLKNEGYNIEELDAEYALFIRKLTGKIEIKLGQEDRVIKNELFKEALLRMKEMGAEALNKILTPLEIEQLAFYRNLDKEIDENEKKVILNDERILKIIEKINRDNK